MATSEAKERNALDKFLSTEDQGTVVAAIREAETTTSGEIKVHIEPRCPVPDSYARAIDLFGRLGLEKTRERNAVLIYIASDDKRFAMVGDTGIHAEVGAPFWSEATATLSQHFKSAKVKDGLVEAIAAIGRRLAAKFPHTDADTNELSDEISTQEPPPKS